MDEWMDVRMDGCCELIVANSTNHPSSSIDPHDRMGMMITMMVMHLQMYFRLQMDHLISSS